MSSLSMHGLSCHMEMPASELSPSFSPLFQLFSREVESEATSVGSAQLLPPADESPPPPPLVQSSLYQAVLEKGL